VIAERAHVAEVLGFDRIWLPDERLRRSVYVALTACALKTEKLGLGVGVTNPYTRHPAVTAATIASIDELRPGNVVLGLGAGGQLSHLGLAPERPRAAVRETIRTVRRLTGGLADVTNGDERDLRGVGDRLEFGERAIPVYIASRGPGLLSLAGELADGVIVGGFADLLGFRFATQQVEAGISKAGRQPSDVRRVAWMYTSLDSNPDRALTAVRPIVLASMITSRNVLDDIGVVLPPRLQEQLDESEWKLSNQDLAHAAEQLNEDIVSAFSLAGRVDECAERLATLIAEGIDEVVFVCFPPPGKSVVELAESIMGDLVPRAIANSSMSSISSQSLKQEH
jgi:5,10-methylenetetrahydromethanopterin reductase